MKINDFQGDLTDISAKEEALLASVSVMSPRNIFILVFKNSIYRIKSTPKYFDFDFESRIVGKHSPS